MFSFLYKTKDKYEELADLNKQKRELEKKFENEMSALKKKNELESAQLTEKQEIELNPVRNELAKVKTSILHLSKKVSKENNEPSAEWKALKAAREAATKIESQLILIQKKHQRELIDLQEKQAKMTFDARVQAEAAFAIITKSLMRVKQEIAPELKAQHAADADAVKQHGKKVKRKDSSTRQLQHLLNTNEEKSLVLRKSVRDALHPTPHKDVASSIVASYASVVEGKIEKASQTKGERPLPLHYEIQAHQREARKLRFEAAKRHQRETLNAKKHEQAVSRQREKLNHLLQMQQAKVADLRYEIKAEAQYYLDNQPIKNVASCIAGKPTLPPAAKENFTIMFKDGSKPCTIGLYVPKPKKLVVDEAVTASSNSIKRN